MGHVINVGTGTPPEPEVGEVVELLVSFGDSSQSYRYVAVRVEHGNWYVTGQAGELPWRRVWENLAGAWLHGARRLVGGEVLAW